MDLNNLKQFSIVLSARDLNPMMLTLDFLKGSDVVPDDWEPARPQLVSQQRTRILFKNGVELLALPGSVQFSNVYGEEDQKDAAVVELAQRYVSVLPNLNYLSVGISPNRFVVFQSIEVVHQFIHGRLLNQGNWQDFGIAPMQATLNLVYTLEHCQLRVSLSEARLRSPDSQDIPGAIFGGVFNYAIQSESAEARVDAVKQALGNWRKDLTTFQTLVDQQFLAGGRELLAAV